MNKKYLGDRLSFKDNTNFLFLFFENINILNWIKTKIQSGPRAAVCRPLLYIIGKLLYLIFVLLIKKNQIYQQVEFNYTTKQTLVHHFFVS